MPPKNPSLVARLPTDQQIEHLTHQYEALHDRIQCVEDGQAEHNKQISQLQTDVTSLRSEVKENTQTAKDTNLLVRELSLFIKGQQTPGLELPGFGFKVKLLEEKVEKWDKWHNRFIWTGAGLTMCGGGLAMYYADKLKAILEILAY